MSVSVEIKTRPIRLAFLVDPNNANQVREAVRLSSTLWGGAYFPIIEFHRRLPSAWKEKKPLPGDRSAEHSTGRSVVLGYINAFDPDFLVQLSDNVPKYVRDLRIRTIKPADIWGDLSQHGKPPPNLGIGLFEILDRIFEEKVTSENIHIAFPERTGDLPLFWASFFGDTPDELKHLSEDHCRGRFKIYRFPLSNENAVSFLSPASYVLFPVDVVSYYIEIHHSVFDRVPHIFFMDAEKVGDIVDFWNLRAMGKSVLPVPRQLKEDPKLKKAVNRFLKWPLPVQDSAHGAQIPSPVARILRARSCSVEEMREYAGGFSDGSLELNDAYPKIWSAGSHHDFPNSVYGEERSFINSATTREDEIRIRSVLPKFRYYGRQRPICANEITIDSYMGADLVAEAFPRSSGENFLRALSGPTSFHEYWRGGRSGLVKLAENGFFRPQEVPLAEEVFFTWLKDIGWKNPELSSPGVLAKRIHQRLEGFVACFQDEKLLWLLEHMSGGSVDMDKGPRVRNKTGPEREMSVGEVKNRLEREEQVVKSLYDYVIENGFFRLGARVKCPGCFRNSWYSLEDIRDSFVCPKCLNSFSALGNLESAGDKPWHYRTAGPFSIPNYADGAYGVLLSLHFFNRLKMGSSDLSITPVMSFTVESPDGEKVEIDFAAFWRGRGREGKVELIIGECKTYGEFKDKDFKRMEYLAQALGEKPVLVFSTLRESLGTEEKKRIIRMAETSPVMILTARELLRRDDYEPDLRNICDITQERYLEHGGSGKPGK